MHIKTHINQNFHKVGESEKLMLEKILTSTYPICEYKEDFLQCYHYRCANQGEATDTFQALLQK